MKTGPAAQDLGRDLAGLEGRNRLHEQVGQAVGRTGSDLAALGPVAVLRKLARDRREILAGANPLQGGERALAPLGDDGHARPLRHGDEDLGDIELQAGGAGAALL